MEPRRAADERCRGAEAARLAAQAVMEQSAATKREYDAHRRAADEAEATADPAAVRTAKETAHQVFRSHRIRASDHDAEEAAARDWLEEVNRINRDAREAARLLEREMAAARALVPHMERLALEADAARISAESAEQACREAREAVARCEEQQAVGTREPAPDSPIPADDVAVPSRVTSTSLGGQPRMVRLLQGDRDELERLAAILGHDDGERTRWRVSLGALRDAIVARAIESNSLDFPEEHAFWGLFTTAQSRDIAGALAALGFRFDGLGGWSDDRVPGQRELSLAVGYAGLDPMRIRHWPREAELAALFEDVTVAADEWLAGEAGELTLGEMIDALGRRAESLTEVWDAWGRLRPRLLEPVEGDAVS